MSPAEKWLALDDRVRERLEAAGVSSGPELAKLGTRELQDLPGVGAATIRAVRELFAAPGGGLVPQPHGGALRRGNPGNKGGGSLPNELRRRLTESFAQRIDFAERVVDGDEGEVQLSVSCPACGTSHNVTLPGARVSDRLRAWELMGKYGPGSGHTFTKEEVSSVMTELARDLQARLREEWGRRRADEFMMELTESWQLILRGYRE